MSAGRNRRVSRSQASHASNPRARRKARDGERAMERDRRTAGMDAPDDDAGTTVATETANPRETEIQAILRGEEARP